MKAILKNIGVIMLAIVVLIVGSIPANLVQGMITNPYLHAMIPCLLRISTTMLLVWLICDKMLHMDADELGIKPKRLSLWWIVIAIALPLVVLGFYALVLPSNPYVTQDGNLAASLFMGFFEVGLSAGVTEELIFRGMIFRYMKKTLGTKAAIIVPAVLFALVHILNMETFVWMDLVLLILAGSSVAVMFTLMALKSDSIYAGAFAHTLWNTLIIGGVFGIGDIVNGAANTSYMVIPVASQSKLLTGGNFGVEAALPAIIGYILVSVICIVGFPTKEEK